METLVKIAEYVIAQPQWYQLALLASVVVWSITMYGLLMIIRCGDAFAAITYLFCMTLLVPVFYCSGMDWVMGSQEWRAHTYDLIMLGLGAQLLLCVAMFAGLITYELVCAFRALGRWIGRKARQTA